MHCITHCIYKSIYIILHNKCNSRKTSCKKKNMSRQHLYFQRQIYLCTLLHSVSLHIIILKKKGGEPKRNNRRSMKKAFFFFI